MLDAENWKIVLQVYAGHPISALTLADQLTAIKQSLQRGRKGIPDAIAGLDLAIEGLTGTLTAGGASVFRKVIGPMVNEKTCGQFVDRIRRTSQ